MIWVSRGKRLFDRDSKDRPHIEERRREGARKVDVTEVWKTNVTRYKSVDQEIKYVSK